MDNRDLAGIITIVLGFTVTTIVLAWIAWGPR
jgi:hypothetical protein